MRIIIALLFLVVTVTAQTPKWVDTAPVKPDPWVPPLTFQTAKIGTTVQWPYINFSATTTYFATFQATTRMPWPHYTFPGRLGPIKSGFYGDTILTPQSLIGQWPFNYLWLNMEIPPLLSEVLWIQIPNDPLLSGFTFYVEGYIRERGQTMFDWPVGTGLPVTCVP